MKTFTRIVEEMVSENIYKNSEENGQWKHLKE